MKRTKTSLITGLALALAGLGAAGAAQAQATVHISVGAAPAVVHRPFYTPAPAPVQLPVHEVHRPRRHAHGWQAACDAPRWDPRVRYMPGQVVRRHGELWVARRISARVWNENSPPEWTPQYWNAAECR